MKNKFDFSLKSFGSNKKFCIFEVLKENFLQLKTEVNMTDFLDVDLTLDGKFADLIGLVKGTILVPDNITAKTIDGLRVVKTTSDGFILTDGDTINSDDIILNGGKLDLLIWLDDVINGRLFKDRI